MPGAKKVLELLKKDGHSLILITARGTLNKEMIKISENILKKNRMYIFEKYYWATENKDEVCEKENIASRKSIINNGGILENEVISKKGKVVQRYWIKT